MNVEKTEEIKDTAIKLDKIYSYSPVDYAYLKGWINCLFQKQNEESCKVSENNLNN